MGAPAAVIEEAVQQEQEQGVFDVYEENMHALGVFLLLVTQWRVVAGLGRAVWLGIEYGSIPPVLDMLEIPLAKRSDLFRDIRVMERGALPILNRKRDSEDA